MGMGYPFPVPKRFLPNIDRKGRILRGVLAGLLLSAGLVTLFWEWRLGLVILAAGAFVLFEAVRGWCFVRACGIKTRI